MPAIESRTEAVWFAKQTAKGSPAVTAVKRGRKVGGDMNVAREDGSQPWSDGLRFATAEDYVNTIVGNGNPTMQGQPGILGYLMYLMLGQESVSAVAGPTGLYDHTATPASASFWSTWWKKVGAAVGPLRQQFNDCRLSSVRVEASSAQKVVQAIPTFVSVDPGVVYTSDPVQAEDTDRAMLYTEGVGRFKIGGQVFRGHSSVAFTLNDGVTPWYGDSPVAYDVIFGTSTVDLEGVTILVDQQGKDFYDELIYGMTSPVAGTKPRTDLPLYGSYEFDLQRGTVADIAITGTPTGGAIKFTIDGVDVSVPYNATATQFQTAIEGAANVAVGDVTVIGAAPFPGGTMRVVFQRAGRTLAVDKSTLSGGTSPNVTKTDRGAEKQFKVTFPQVKWAPDVAIPGNPDGGAVELALGGQVRKDPSNPLVTALTRNADAAYT